MKTYRNYDDLPKIELPYGQEVSISDSTIRDGAQMPGIVIKSRHKVQIYEYLHQIGIEKLESFVYNDRDKKAIKLMQDKGYEFPEITGWARANSADIDMVLNVDGIEETGILMSVSDPHIYDKMKLASREVAQDKYLDALQYAVDHGLKTRAHIEDMTRADNYDFVFPLVEKILEIDNKCIIRICDTIGFGIPFEGVDEPYGMSTIVEHLRKKLGAKNIEMHCHDDFGLAVANTIAGYWHGANWANVTYLGIGERSGNAEMEKLLVFLNQRVKGFEKYDLNCLIEFANYMQKEIGIRIPRNKSVVGENVFAHESGIHTAGVIKNPFTYEPYDPTIVGGKRNFLIGDSSGIEVLKFKVQEALKEMMDVDIEINKNDRRLRSIQTDIQRLFNDEKRISCISDEEILMYVKKYFLLNSMVNQDFNRRIYDYEFSDNYTLNENDKIKPHMHDEIND